MKIFFTLVCVLSVQQRALAQSPNWTSDIAPILYSNCTNCHHDGGLAPFSLIGYENALLQSQSVLNDVIIRKMPPWPPDPIYKRLAYERLLSSQDIQTISDWVNAGAPAGDTSSAPPPPVYSGNQVILNPDYSSRIPNYTVPSTQSSDIYQCFVLPSGIAQDMFITAMEVLPGNASIVHHVLVYEDTTGTAAQLDAATPEPGYTDFGGIGTNSAILIGGWVPGSRPYFYPAGTGVKLYKNADVVVQVHYPLGSADKTDSTRINFVLSSSDLRNVYNAPILNHQTDIINGPLHLPANTITTYEEYFQTPAIPFSVISVAPHCHLLGKQWICYAVTPDHDTMPLIKINNWDFHWQGSYPFRNLLKLPAFTKLYAYCTYDNTSNNSFNPNNPPIDVNVGENTTDEMMLVYFSFMVYEPGDENMVIDSSALVDIGNATGIQNSGDVVKTLQLYNPSPNPANDEIAIQYFAPSAGDAVIIVYNLQGEIMLQQNEHALQGYNFENLDTRLLKQGLYYVYLNNGNEVRTKAFEILK